MGRIRCLGTCNADTMLSYVYSYWVCEKSDGIRVLLLVYTDMQTEAQSVYLVSSRFALSSHMPIPTFSD